MSRVADSIDGKRVNVAINESRSFDTKTIEARRCTVCERTSSCVGATIGRLRLDGPRKEQIPKLRTSSDPGHRTRPNCRLQKNTWFRV